MNGDRSGILQWDTDRIISTGDLPAEATARGMFDSLWAKSYSRQSGKLLSISDKSTLAPQPLHFRADDLHGVDVYLDAEGDVQYSGNVTVDSRAGPVFEALLRTLYRCKSPDATPACVKDKQQLGTPIPAGR